ncbi:condensation domain-containing protein [Jatrophihabitans sp.]|uniref:condensation domain-containing protein n=1 Tax=Jatrophihabitans sp. TaxID=1932789 RepID=UPI002C8320CB|nr:condensation domain-containing protein [Jatrophihabitans sp.]
MSLQPAESRLVVPFAGTVSGRGPLTWGEKALLQDQRETGLALNATGAQNLAAGTTVESAAARLGKLLSEQPALRVRLGTDEDGTLYQQVHSGGEVAVEVLDFADSDDPVEVARYTERLWQEWLIDPIDHFDDWPARMGVVRHRGRTLYQILSFNHLVIDGTSMRYLMPEMGVGEPPAGAGRTTPINILQLADYEHSEAAQKISRRAMRFWESHLRDIPPRTFGEPSYPEGRLGKRYWHATFGSPAAYQAVLAIAQRSGGDVSRVMFAVLAVALGRAMGLDRLRAKVILSNRYRPGFSEVIASLALNGIISIDLTDATVDEVMARGRQALLVSGMHSYYDPDHLNELMARLDDERGYPAAVTLRMNDRRRTTQKWMAEEARARQVTPADIESRLGETFFSWDGTLDTCYDDAFVTIEDYRGTFHLQLIFDMACFTDKQIEDFVYGVEQVAIEAAFNPDVPAGCG